MKFVCPFSRLIKEKILFLNSCYSGYPQHEMDTVFRRGGMIVTSTTFNDTSFLSELEGALFSTFEIQYEKPTEIIDDGLNGGATHVRVPLLRSCWKRLGKGLDLANSYVSILPVVCLSY